ncbi:hypothetical protein GCM10023317_24860 [Actinopolymorpha pittospori]
MDTHPRRRWDETSLDASTRAVAWTRGPVRTVRADGARLHDPRHGAATLALAAGVEVRTVSDQLGYSAMGVTSDIHTTVLPHLATAGAEAVARWRPSSPRAHLRLPS